MMDDESFICSRSNQKDTIFNNRDDMKISKCNISVINAVKFMFYVTI